jgi:hypothetical protein
MRLLVIALFSVCGAVLGWDTAAVTHVARNHVAVPLDSSKRSQTFSLPHSTTLVIVPVPAATSSDVRRAQDIEKLETRNRRLEALVKALQNRKTEKQP